jgi:ABC-type uncharacterized transport system permease subunit
MSVVKLLFTHVHITVPKFMLREIGPDAAIGKTYSINGAMMMIILPLIAVFIARFNTNKVIVAGALISSLSPVFLPVEYSVSKSYRRTSVSFVIARPLTSYILLAIKRRRSFRGSSNGRTTGSGPVNQGSNPCPRAWPHRLAV